MQEKKNPVEVVRFKGNPKIYLSVEGTCGYSHVIKPDTYTDPALFKLDLIVEEDVLGMVQDAYNDVWDELVALWKADPKNEKKLKSANFPTSVEVKTKKSKDDSVALKCKSRYRPSVTIGETTYNDKYNTEELDSLRYIKGGSPVRCLYELVAFPAFGGGVSLRLVNVAVPNVECTGKAVLKG